MSNGSLLRIFHLRRMGDLFFASQTEVLIGFARLVFSCFALLAVYLDPTRPRAYLDETYELLWLYLLYSVVILFISRYHTYGKYEKIATHLIDIFALSILIHLTDGLESPFFSFYTFSLFTATMRWRWRGSMATVAILGFLLLIASWEDIEIEFNRDSQLNLLVMRAAYLFVAGGLLGYFGAYMERSRVRLAKLADWPLEGKALLDDPLPTNALAHAAQVLGSPQVLVYWQDPDGREGKLASWSSEIQGINSVASIARHSSQLPELVDRAVFYPIDNPTGARRLLYVFSLLKGFQSPDEPRKPRSYSAAPFRSTHYQGCVFVLDPQYHSEDIVPLTRIVAVRIVSELERRILTKELAESAISGERMRLSRDMHDSVLQDLAAASLLLKMISDRMPGKMAGPLKEARWLLTNQQRRIRNFITETSSTSAEAERKPLGGNLESLVGMLQRQWQCEMTAQVSPPDLQVERSLSAEIFQLVCEATANAVRHGGATRITVQIARILDNFRLEIADNGTGMPTGKTIEPQSIKKRVTALGGKLLMLTSGSGVQLSIDLPGG